MKNEEWRPVVGYESLYMVSNYGRVKSLNYMHTGKEHLLAQQRNKKYLRVKFCKNGIVKRFHVHDLVAKAFPDICGEWFEGAQVNHKDENGLNNCAWNLETCTASYNNRYGTKVKRMIASRNGYGAEKTVYQYDLDWNYIREWKSAGAAANNGYNRSCINGCCLGKHKMHKGYIWSYEKRTGI